jgi:hypothetical protein
MALLLDYWKPVVGFEGIYEVSCTGRLRTLKPQNWSHRDYPNLTIRLDGAKNPYPVVTLNHKQRFKTIRVHQIVAWAFLGPQPSKHDVNHKDGNKRNNQASNLEYVTRSQNQLHAQEHGLKAVGEKVYNAKLNPEKVRKIRGLKGKLGRKRIAKQLGVSEWSVRSVIDGRSWKHVT